MDVVELKLAQSLGCVEAVLLEKSSQGLHTTGHMRTAVAAVLLHSLGVTLACTEGKLWWH